MTATILAMDDSRLIRQLWLLLARSIGYECVTVATPGEAIENLRSQTLPFCALFLDIFCEGAIPDITPSGPSGPLELNRYGGLHLAKILRDQTYQFSLPPDFISSIPKQYCTKSFPIFALSSETGSATLDHFKKYDIPVLAKKTHLNHEGIQNIRLLLNNRTHSKVPGA